MPDLNALEIDVLQTISPRLITCTPQLLRKRHISRKRKSLLTINIGSPNVLRELPVIPRYTAVESLIFLLPPRFKGHILRLFQIDENLSDSQAF